MLHLAFHSKLGQSTLIGCSPPFEHLPGSTPHSMILPDLNEFRMQGILAAPAIALHHP